MRTLVVLPTYNEVDNLAAVVRRLRAVAPAATVLVVDDASPDGTGELAAELARTAPRLHVLHRPGKGGLGAAYRAGFAWGLARDFDAFVEMDADLSHDPADVPRLLSALAGADLVIGSRYVPGGGVRDWPARRQRLSRGGNRYVQLLTGVPVRDATSGLRAFRRAVLRAIDLEAVHSEGYCFQVDVTLRAWRAGFRVLEIPITFVERRAGASKINRTIVLEAVVRTACWGAAGPRHPAPPHPHSSSAAAPRFPSPPAG